MAKRKVGVFLIGAYGGVATTVIVGARAMARNLVPSIGLITDTAAFKKLSLVPVADLVFGGMDIRRASLVESAEEVAASSGTISPEILNAVRPDLKRWEKNVTPGSVQGSGERIGSLATGTLLKGTTLAVIEKIRLAIRQFKKRERLAEVVVADVASTEPHLATEPAWSQKLSALEKALKANEPLPTSILYAYAALQEGCPIAHFTPSLGVCCPALEQLAVQKKLPFMGKDGKTGETLVKTTLGQMFVERAIKVMSWEGYNIFGDRDAVVLDDPKNNLAKTTDKDRALKMLLKDPEMHSRVRIDYCPSLGDWKTAWDFIHFKGFMGVPMRMHFIWEGCDAILAAPLVLDLVRLLDLARRKKQKGVQRHLACFFKNPYRVDEQGFPAQFRALATYVERLSR